jgi:hypothetical protein
MKLKNSDLNLIHEALLDAFKPDSLSIMLNARLGIRLSDITPQAAFQTMVHDVIEWAERNDVVDALVAGAKAEVPTNRKLSALPDTFADAGYKSIDKQPEPQAGGIGDSSVNFGGAVTFAGGVSQIAGRDLTISEIPSPQNDKQRDDQFNIALNWKGESMRGFDLSGRDLTGLILEQADLTSADLNHATLLGVTLSGAKLFNANLEGANLSYSVLSNAIMLGANLCGADLSGAELTGTVLRGAKYNDSTRWPMGFDAAPAGAVKNG